MDIFEKIFGNNRQNDADALLDPERCTYSRLLKDSECLAEQIKTLTSGEKEIVAILFPVSREYITAILSLYLCDCVIVPMNPNATPSELAYILESSRASLLLTSLSKEKTHSFSGEEGEKSFGNMRLIKIRQADVQYGDPDGRFLIYTSGSTGQPKGAVLSNSAISNNVAAVAENLKLTPNDKTIVFTPPAYTYAISQILTHLWAGASIIPWAHGMMYPHMILKKISEHRLTGIAANPTLFKMFDLSERKDLPFKSVRYVISGGQPLYSGLAGKLTELFSEARVISMYGCTENSPRISHFWLPEEIPERNIPWCVGDPLNGVEVKIADGEGNELAQGKEGEILIKGTSLMSGYWREPDLTAERIIDGWFSTRDLGFWDEDNKLNVVGRIDNVFSVAHEKVSPEEIESVISKLDSVMEVAVGPLEDELLLYVPAALVVINREYKDLDDQIKNVCREKLSSVKVPQKIFVVDEIPKTAYGKLDRRKIKGIITKLNGVAKEEKMNYAGN